MMAGLFYRCPRGSRDNPYTEAHYRGEVPVRYPTVVGCALCSLAVRPVSHSLLCEDCFAAVRLRDFSLLPPYGHSNGGPRRLVHAPLPSQRCMPEHFVTARHHASYEMSNARRKALWYAFCRAFYLSDADETEFDFVAAFEEARSVFVSQARRASFLSERVARVVRREFRSRSDEFRPLLKRYGFDFEAIVADL